MPLRLIGLTGGIGAGKSEALAAFGRLGVATASTDQIVHELLATDELHKALVDRWGPEVAPGGKVDRDRIAAIVFERPDELKWLEDELHPRVGRELIARRNGLPPEVKAAVVEVPLLFETGMEVIFDATVAIVADEAVRHARAEARGHAGLPGRTDRQLTQEAKAARATHTIVNDGTIADLEAKLAELLERIVASE